MWSILLMIINSRTRKIKEDFQDGVYYRVFFSYNSLFIITFHDVLTAVKSRISCGSIYEEQGEEKKKKLLTMEILL
jgi:hypothetical protein